MKGCESLIFSPASEDSALGWNGQECAPSHSARSIPSAVECSPSIGLPSPAIPTSENLQARDSRQMELLPMSCVEGSLARTSPVQDRAKALTANAAGYGRNTPALLTSFDQATSSWKMLTISLFGGSDEFSETWPRSGMTRSGTAYRLPPLAPIIGEIVSGSLPTPTRLGFSRFTSSGGSHAQQKWAKMLPTLTRHDYRGGCKPERLRKMREQSARGLDLPSVLRLLFPHSTGLVRPSWGEARMGFPIGWTEL